MKPQEARKRPPIIDTDVLRTQMVLLGWNQDELVRRTGYAKRTLQKILHSGRTKAETAAAINDALHKAWMGHPYLAGTREYCDIRSFTKNLSTESTTQLSTPTGPRGDRPPPPALQVVAESSDRVTPPANLLLSSYRLRPSSVNQNSVHGTTASFPDTMLFTKTVTPQWADYREIDLLGGRLQSLECLLGTSSPYFRFGFKLRTNQGRLFGDGSIQSTLDPNVIVHIGRNNRSRDLFFTSYRNGIREAPDKVLCIVPESISVSIVLTIDDMSMLVLSVNDASVYERSVPSELRSSMVMLAWGDHSDFEVKVTNLRVSVRP